MFDKLIEVLAHWWERLVPFLIVTEYERGVVLRFGRYHRELTPGFHWVIPLVEQWITHNVVPSVHMSTPQSLTTRDGHQCVVQALITWKVHNIKKMLLEVEDAGHALGDAIPGLVAQHVNRLTWEELCADGALDPVMKEARSRGFKWGIEVMQVSMSDLQRCKSLRIWQDHR